MDSRRETNIWELCELKRARLEILRMILVRRFGPANRNSHDDLRMNIILEEVGIRQARVQVYASESQYSIIKQGGCP